MSGSKDRGVQFWDPITGNAQMMLQGHKNSGQHFFPYLSCHSLWPISSVFQCLTGFYSHLGCSQPYRQFVRHGQWRHAGENLEVCFGVQFLLLIWKLTPGCRWQILHLYRTVMGLMMGSFGANVTSFVCLIHNVVASLNMAWVCFCVQPLQGSVLSHRSFGFSFPRWRYMFLKMTKLCMYG